MRHTGLSAWSRKDNQLFHPPPDLAAHDFDSFQNGVIIPAIGNGSSKITAVRK